MTSDELANKRCCGRRLHATWLDNGDAVWKCRACSSIRGSRPLRSLGPHGTRRASNQELIARRGGEASAADAVVRAPHAASERQRPARRPLSLAEVFGAIDSATDGLF